MLEARQENNSGVAWKERREIWCEFWTIFVLLSPLRLRASLQPEVYLGATRFLFLLFPTFFLVMDELNLSVSHYVASLAETKNQKMLQKRSSLARVVEFPVNASFHGKQRNSNVMFRSTPPTAPAQLHKVLSVIFIKEEFLDLILNSSPTYLSDLFYTLISPVWFLCLFNPLIIGDKGIPKKNI